MSQALLLTLPVFNTSFAVLADFQMTYARKAWQEEHSAWRSVIQLNLCRTVNFILDILTEEMAFEGALSTPSPGDLVANTPVPSAGPSAAPDTLQAPEIEVVEREGNGAAAKSPELLASPVASPNSLSTPRTPHSGDAHGSPALLPKLLFGEKHKLLKLKLGPLRRVQRDLEVRLGAGAEEPSPALAGAAMTDAAPFGMSAEGSGPAGAGRGGGSRSDAGPGAVTSFFVPPSRRGPQEFYVRSSTGWKAALDRLRPLGSAARASSERARDGSGREAARNKEVREAKETTEIIAACREEIGALWGDEVVRSMLARRRLRLEERGGL